MRFGPFEDGVAVQSGFLLARSVVGVVAAEDDEETSKLDSTLCCTVNQEDPKAPGFYRHLDLSFATRIERQVSLGRLENVVKTTR